MIYNIHIIYIDDINSCCTYRIGLHMLHVAVQGMPRKAHCPPQRQAQCLIGDVIIFCFEDTNKTMWMPKSFNMEPENE